MGKRELVLIVAFVLLGICVYQFTAPPPPPGSEGISVSGIFRNMKRGIRGARESASADSTQTIPVGADVTALRVNIVRPGDLTVAGEDRADIAAELHVTARGYDQAEAKAAADATKLRIERSGAWRCGWNRTQDGSSSATSRRARSSGRAEKRG